MLLAELALGDVVHAIPDFRAAVGIVPFLVRKRHSTPEAACQGVLGEHMRTPGFVAVVRRLDATRLRSLAPGERLGRIDDAALDYVLERGQVASFNQSPTFYSGDRIYVVPAHLASIELELVLLTSCEYPVDRLRFDVAKGYRGE